MNKYCQIFIQIYICIVLLERKKYKRQLYPTKNKRRNKNQQTMIWDWSKEGTNKKNENF